MRPDQVVARDLGSTSEPAVGGAEGLLTCLLRRGTELLWLSREEFSGRWTRTSPPIPSSSEASKSTKALLRADMVGATGFEPVTSSVSGHARPFTRSLDALHGTTSPLLTRITEPGTTVRREAAHGIAADKLLTAGRELHMSCVKELAGARTS
jgi:hypothetical protein